MSTTIDWIEKAINENYIKYYDSMILKMDWYRIWQTRKSRCKSQNERIYELKNQLTFNIDLN